MAALPHRSGLLAAVGLGLVVAVALLAVTSYYFVQLPFVKFTLQAGECKWGPPLAGVYLSGRLRLVDRCRTVTGTVDCLKVEPDGDIHLRLRLDPQFAGLLEPANAIQVCADQPGPHLVVEIIPQRPQGILFRTNNADAGGFVDPRTPAPGDHITVSGPYVIDTNILHRVLYQGRAAENWAEIHPAWAIRVDRPAQPGQPNQFGPEFGETQ
ncbi:MAG TPA: hypothetical protein VEQ12_06300 [Candidatus Limnocylindria bacterium]|nr:hypothetical protein [Candidatus Limnocylindria bacterium]